MNIEDIIKLIEKMDATDISELKINDENFKLYLNKNNPSVVHTESSVPMQTVIKQKVTETIEDKTETNPNDNIVKAPLVGIFYEAASPESKPYVSLGQRVKEGDTLCIIEAMKVFNEIKSPYSGIVKKIFPSNLEVIEYDQELFIIGEEE